MQHSANLPTSRPQRREQRRRRSPGAPSVRVVVPQSRLRPCARARSLAARATSPGESLPLLALGTRRGAGLVLLVLLVLLVVLLVALLALLALLAVILVVVLLAVLAQVADGEFIVLLAVLAEVLLAVLAEVVLVLADCARRRRATRVVRRGKGIEE